jgi:hypothetical protein
MLWPYTAKLLKVIVRSTSMADPVTAIVGSTVASVGGSLIGGRQASKAAQSAASSQEAAAAYAADVQREMFQKQTQLQEPFRQAGVQSQNRLLALLGMQPTEFGPGNPWNEGAYLRANPGVAKAVREGKFTSGLAHYEQFGRREGRNLGFTPKAAQTPDFGKYTRDFSMQDFQADPGYAFRMSEGMKGLERSAAARGGLLSGAAMKGIQRFGQDLGSQEYMNAFNRYQTNRANQLNPLQSLSGAGQTSANTLSSAAGQYGQGASEAAYQGANARASGYVGSANAWNQALGGMTNAIGQGVGMVNFMRPTAPAASYGFSSVPGTTGVNAFL